MKYNCCWVNYKWVIIQTVKVVLELLNYATKKELEHATGVDTFDLAAKNLNDLGAEVDPRHC